MRVRSRSRIAWPTSTYEADSFTNRSPAWSTMIAPGIDRSHTENCRAPSGETNAGPHQASSISAVSAPSAIPSLTRSPVSPRLADDHSSPAGWWSRRKAPSRAKPPAASRTPRRARTRVSSPSCAAEHDADDAAGLDDGLDDRRRAAGARRRTAVAIAISCADEREPGRERLPPARTPGRRAAEHGHRAPEIGGAAERARQRREVAGLRRERRAPRARACVASSGPSDPPVDDLRPRCCARPCRPGASG